MARCELVATATKGVVNLFNKGDFAINKHAAKPFNKIKSQCHIDEFIRSKTYRDNELFNTLKDSEKPYPTYDSSDVPLAENLRSELTKLSTTIANKVFDAGSSPKTILIKNNKEIYQDIIENFLIENQRYEELNFFDDCNNQFGFEATANILHNSIRQNMIDIGFAKRGFLMIKEGYPLEFIVHSMNLAALKKRDGEKNLKTDFLDFIIQAMDKKDLVIVKDTFGNEQFDKASVALVFEWQECLKSREELKEAISACRSLQKDGKILVDKDLVEIANILIDHNNSWQDDFSKILCELKTIDKLRTKSFYKETLEEVKASLHANEYPATVLESLKETLISFQMPT